MSAKIAPGKADLKSVVNDVLYMPRPSRTMSALLMAAEPGPKRRSCWVMEAVVRRLRVAMMSAGEQPRFWHAAMISYAIESLNISHTVVFGGRILRYSFEFRIWSIIGWQTVPPRR